MEITDIVNGVAINLNGEHITLATSDSNIRIHQNTWELIKECVDKMMRMKNTYQGLE